MKRIMAIIVAVLTVIFYGCGKMQTYESNTTTNYRDELNIDSIEDRRGRDNTIDAYTSIVNKSFDVGEMENEIGGGRMLGIDYTYAFYLKKHLFDEIDKSYDEIVYINKRGDSFKEEYSLDNQIWVTGETGESGFHLRIMLNKQEGFCAYIFDDSGEIKTKISLEKINDDIGEKFYPYEAAYDRSGCLHLYGANSSGESGLIYFAISDNGEIVKKFDLESYIVYGLSIVLDGCAAIKVSPKDKSEEKKEQIEYSWITLERNGISTLFSYVEKANMGNRCLLPCDKNNIIYADTQGVYSCDDKFSNVDTLYLFSNHGIKVDEVIEVQLQQTGIGVIYRTGNVYGYLYLEPVEDKIDIIQIKMAVSATNKKMYEKAVTNFNKRYPTCNIQLEEYNDIMVLNTKLISGEGPVIIDTSLVEFEENEKLWEPLDQIFKDVGILDDLNTNMLELGKIKGILYGVNTNFTINSVVVGDALYQNWNYDDFIDAIKEESNRNITNSEDVDSDAIKIMSFFFIHGLDDNYFIDLDNAKASFDTSKCRELFKILKNIQLEKKYIVPGESIYTGDVLLNQISIAKPEELAAYMSLYGEEAIFVGYPHKDGAYSLIYSSPPICIRNSASKEEKELACAFLKELLSYEYQKDMINTNNYGLSIRNDLLYEQILECDFKNEVYIAGLGYVQINSKITSDNVKERLEDMLSRSKPQKTFPKALNQIIIDEIEEYFSGVMDEKELTRRLNSRSELFLKERQ